MSAPTLLLVTAALLAASTAITEAKTVVFFPPPSTSYIVYHTNVAGALVTMGHDVWICVPHFLMPRNLVKDNTVKILEYGEYLGDFETRAFRNSRMSDKFWADDNSLEIVAFYLYASEYHKASRQVLADKIFLDTIRGLKPDLIVLESIPFNMNMIVLPYMLDIPYALIGTLHDILLSKVPFSPFVPNFPIEGLSDRMTFIQRVQNFLLYVVNINVDLFYDSSLVSTFAPHRPYKSINDLAANSEVIIAELDHILDYPRATLPNTKLVGGSSASHAKPLDGEFKKFVEKSKKGIVVVSFGGHVINIPPHISSKLASAFKQLDLDVVWRVNITSPDPTHILTSRWIPQNDLLGHEKAKLFISHCGKNGQYEALFHAVPILCLPIFGDQDYNAERIKVKELGLRADMRRASAEELAAMIKQIVYDGKYSENMKKASSLYRELYKVPKQEAAYWLDHVMKYGGAYMRSTGQKMSWYQIYVLDILAFLIGVLILVVSSVYLLVRQCYRYCRGSDSKKKKSKKQ